MLAIKSAKVILDPATQAVHVEASLTDPDAYNTLAEVSEEHRPDFVLRALKIGTLALRDARTVARTDYVEKEFLKLRNDFAQQLEATFGEQGRVTRKIAEVFGDDGAIDRKMKAFFGEGGRFEKVMDDFLGEDGELQRYIDTTIGEDGDFHRTLDEFLGDRGRLRQELEREFGPDGGRLYRILNPNDPTTPLGALRRTLEERFDPAREGSALWDLKNDMRLQIEQLRRDLGVKEAVASERAKGHEKGFDFEDSVFHLVNRIAVPYGDHVEDTGKVKGPLGDVGDIVVGLDAEATGGLERRIVLEAKNRSVTLSGKTSIHKELDEALRNRDAHFAIAVVAREHADRFAPLQYVAPDHLLVGLDPEEDDLPLRVAYQLARALVISRSQRREASLDVEGLVARLHEINGQMETVRAMKMGLTGAVKNIEDVKNSLDQLRQNVEGSVQGLIQMVQKEEHE